MRSAIAIALLSGCTFGPPPALDPEKDAELTELDAGVADADDPDGGDPIDAGAEPDAGANTPPIANTGPPQRGLVWDTIAIDGSASSDPDGDPISHRWIVASRPANAAGGFAPFPGAATSTLASTSLHPDRAGPWVLRLEVSDSSTITTATVTITIAEFEPIPPPSGVTAGEVLALALADRRLYLGVKPHGGQFYDLMTETSSSIPCAIGDKTNDIAIAPSGEAYYALDDQSHLVATDGSACRTIEISGPTKIKDIEFISESEEYFVATDRDAYGWLGGEFVKLTNDQMGNDARYRAIAVVDDELMWLGSDEGGGRDGAIATSIPPIPSSPIRSFFPGDDKVTAIAGGFAREAWIASEVGIVHIPDTATPTVSTVFAAASIPLPLNAVMLGVAFDPESGDVFFANQLGIARYKRDVGAIVAIPQGTSGLSAGVVRAIRFDPRSRSLYVGNQQGAFVARP